MIFPVFYLLFLPPHTHLNYTCALDLQYKLHTSIVKYIIGARTYSVHVFLYIHSFNLSFENRPEDRPSFSELSSMLKDIYVYLQQNEPVVSNDLKRQLPPKPSSVKKN